MPKDPRIENRESWLKVLLGTVIVLVTAWKVLSLEIAVVELQFSDLLALALSLFAIGLSAAFYFQANRVSNTFYDNVYRFTKEVSELLGRIESGFGEKLQYLGDRYDHLQDRIDQIPLRPRDAAEAEQQLAGERARLDSEVQSKDEILDELMHRARLNEAERARYREQLMAKDAEIHRLQEVVGALQKQVEKRKLVDRAKGILMDNMGMSEADAYTFLQKRSQQTNTPMAEVAKKVIEGAEMFQLV